MNALTPAPSAGEITPPWAPIVRLPALNHALIVMDWHVEMHEVYSPVCSFRGEGEDQGRIRITVVKFGRAPGLDHEPLRDDLEDRTGERAVEGLEWCTRLSADRDLAPVIAAWFAGSMYIAKRRSAGAGRTTDWEMMLRMGHSPGLQNPETRSAHAAQG